MGDAFTNFTNDFAKLQRDAGNYQEAVKAHEEARKSYLKGLLSSALNIDSGSSWKDVGRAYQVLVMLIAGGGSQMLSGGLGVKGEALTIQGDLAKCGNDLQAITQSTNPVGSGGKTDVINEVKGLDQMLDVLGTTGEGSTSWYNEVQKAIGGTGGATASSLDGEFSKIRDLFYWSADPESGKYNPPQASVYYFDPSDPTKLQSFYDMQQQMGQQGGEDATAASKKMVDGFNTNNATTQSANAASNVEISQLANDIKTGSSFISDMAHAEQDVTKAVIANMVR
jgi:hypothetical protein